MKDYLAQAAQTAPKTILGTIPSTLVLDCLKDIIGQGNKLDRLKKTMFYGKELEGYTEEVLRGHTPVPVNRLPALLLGVKSELAAVEVIHGIVGAITETVELAEALVVALESGIPIDMVNLSEECGDVLWYLACILRHTDKDFPQVQEQNIAKLRKRYPNGFVTYDAIHRNLDAEREVLEEGAKVKPECIAQMGRLIPINGVLHLAGVTDDHPTAKGVASAFRSSPVVSVVGNVVETQNTIYIVGSWEDL